MCKITVLMPVYNCEKYLRESIESILNQTFNDFELIVINDCSTDQSREIIKSYDDERIVLIENDKNLGISESLNKGLAIAKGKYIARMDGDDISFKNRLVKQYEFMEKNKDIGLCGTHVEVFNKSNSRIHRCPIENEEIRVLQIFNSAFAHPTVMIRNRILKKYNLKYDSYYDGMEDYHLWIKISEVSKVANLNDVLLKYRDHDNQVTKKMTKLQLLRSRELREINLSKLSSDFTNEEMNCFLGYCHNTIFKNERDILTVFKIFDTLILKNKHKNIYNQEVLERIISDNVYWSIRKYKEETKKKLNYNEYAYLMSLKIRFRAFFKNIY